MKGGQFLAVLLREGGRGRRMDTLFKFVA